MPLDHPPAEPTRPVYEPLPRYVAVFNEFEDGSLDFVVVDGHYRQACILAALPKLKVGGLLMLDNSNWLSDREWGIPVSWPLDAHGFERHDGHEHLGEAQGLARVRDHLARPTGSW